MHLELDLSSKPATNHGGKVMAATAISEIGSDFLFVECDGRTGRPSKKNRPLMNSHIMLRQAAKSSRTITPNTTAQFVTTLRSDEDHKQEGQTTLDSSAKKRAQKKLNSRAAAASPAYKGLASFDAVLDKVCRLYFYCHDDPKTKPFESAKYNWSIVGWDFGRKSDLVREGIYLNAFRKQAQLEGDQRAYLHQTSKLISMIRQRTLGKKLDAMTMTAIGILAFCALQDRDIQSSAIHLTALRQMGAEKLLAESKQEWLYLSWTDFRYSLILSTPPLLRYCVPKAYSFALPPDVGSEQQAKENARHCLRSTFISLQELEDIFRKLYYMAHLSNNFTAGDEPPYGLVYDLEFNLRVLCGRMAESKAADEDTELLLMALQLSVWVMSRFWAPASFKSRRWLLQRASTEVVNEIYLNTTISTNPRYQIWILAMICCCSLEVEISRDVAPIQTLSQLLSSLGINDYDALMAELSQWPSTEDWHPAKYDFLWQEVLLVRGEMSSETPHDWRSSHPFYLGPIEFYDG